MFYTNSRNAITSALRARARSRDTDQPGNLDSAKMSAFMVIDRYLFLFAWQWRPEGGSDDEILDSACSRSLRSGWLSGPHCAMTELSICIRSKRAHFTTCFRRTAAERMWCILHFQFVFTVMRATQLFLTFSAFLRNSKASYSAVVACCLEQCARNKERNHWPNDLLTIFVVNWQT